jgi:hypothetical protein
MVQNHLIQIPERREEQMETNNVYSLIEIFEFIVSLSFTLDLKCNS